MGALLSAPLQHRSGGERWSVDDLMPLPPATHTVSDEMRPGVDAVAADTCPGARDYVECCLQVLLSASYAEASAALQWRVPPTVSLAGVFAKGARAAATASQSASRPASDVAAVVRVLAQCGAVLTDHPLVGLYLDSHREITGHEVLVWARLVRVPATLRATAPWRQLRCLSLSDCPLGDAGVFALCAMLYPLPDKQRAAVAALTQVPAPGSSLQPHTLLPWLEALLLDGVGLCDSGAARLHAHLEAAAKAALPHQIDCKRAHSGAASATALSSPHTAADVADQPCLLPYLSVQRNELSGAGVVELVRTCTSARCAASTASRMAAVGAVNVAWNSFAAPPESYSRDVAACVAAHQRRLTALGTALVARVQESATPPAQPERGRPVAQALLLQGCDVTSADVRAFCVDGLLHTYRDELRVQAHEEVHQSRLAAPPSWLISARLVRVDLSHNRHLGDTGVRLLLSTLLCLEAVGEVTGVRPRRRHPSWRALTHPFQHLETLSLRDVGCTEAVLGDVLRLLLSNTELAVSALDDVASTICDGPAFEEAVQHTLLSEAQLLAGLHAEPPADATESDAAAAAGVVEVAEANGGGHVLLSAPCIYVSNLRLLDLSENAFASPALAGAVLAAAVLRVSCASACGGPVVVGLERCGLTDATLSHVPFAMEALRPELPPTTFRTSLPLCTWHLGGNALTHAALLRLRRYMDELASLPLQSERVCAVRAYVEGNAVAHPRTRIGEAVVSDSGDARATPASLAPDHSGITPVFAAAATTAAVMRSSAHPSGIHTNGHEPNGADCRRDDAHSAPLGHYGVGTVNIPLEEGTDERVSWTVLPVLPVTPASGMADVDRGADTFTTPTTEQQRRGSDGRGSVGSASMRGSSGFFTVPSMVPTTAVLAAATPRHLSAAQRAHGNGCADAPARQRTSGLSDLLQSMSDVEPAELASPTAALPPSQTPGRTIDFIDAFIAEAEQVMRERRQFVVDMERQVAAAERHSLGAPHSSSPTPWM